MGKGGNRIGARGSAWIAVILAALALGAPAAASAETRYASPNGTGADPCIQSVPCNIYVATGGTTASDNDTILLNPGTYNLTQGPVVPPALSALGPAVPGTRPTLSSTNGDWLTSVNNSTVEDIRITSTNLNNAAALDLNSGSAARRVEVVTNGSNAVAVQLTANSSLVDSTAWSRSTGGAALSIGAGGGLVRNVTAIGSGSGSFGLDAEFPQTSAVSNTILRGLDADIRTAMDVGEITIDHSDFVDVEDPDTDITEGDGNIEASPLFRSLSTGNFHQCPGSPTIDAGTTDDISLTDIDGQARHIGTAPDIGADEFSGALCPRPVSAPPPIVKTGERERALKRCKRKAKKKDWSKKKRKKCKRRARQLPV